MNASAPFLQEGPGGPVRRVRLAGGRGNCLGRSALRELESLFSPPEGDRRPVVLTHDSNSFCTGLDLDEVYPLDRSGMGEFMEQFHHALRAAVACPVPVVAALAGHALAGGALLALAADSRILASGRAKVGVHGVQLEIAYPQVAVEIMRHHFARDRCEHALYTGELCSDRRALELGWVDRLVDPEELDEVAADTALRLAGTGDACFALNKARGRRACLDRLEVYDLADADRWLDQWFSPLTRECLGGARRPRESSEPN